MISSSIIDGKKPIVSDHLIIPNQISHKETFYLFCSTSEQSL